MEEKSKSSRFRAFPRQYDFCRGSFRKQRAKKVFCGRDAKMAQTLEFGKPANHRQHGGDVNGLRRRNTEFAHATSPWACPERAARPRILELADRGGWRTATIRSRLSRATTQGGPRSGGCSGVTLAAASAGIRAGGRRKSLFPRGKKNLHHWQICNSSAAISVTTATFRCCPFLHCCNVEMLPDRRTVDIPGERRSPVFPIQRIVHEE